MGVTPYPVHKTYMSDIAGVGKKPTPVWYPPSTDGKGGVGPLRPPKGTKSRSA